MRYLKSFKGRLQDEKGAALVISLLMMIVLTLLGFTAMMYSTMDLSVAGNERSALAAQYVAEAGISEGVRAISLPGVIEVLAPGEEYVPGALNVAGVSRTVGNYTYTVTAKYKIDENNANFATGDLRYTEVMLFNTTYYPDAKRALSSGGFPVVTITSTATPVGSSAKVSIIEVDVTKFTLPIMGKIKGAVTANGAVKTTGNINVSGWDNDENGTPFNNTSGMPGITSQSTIEKGGSTTLDGNGGGMAPTADPGYRIKDIYDALGLDATEGPGILAKAKHYTTDPTDSYPDGPTPGDLGEGGIMYVERAAGAKYGESQLDGNGILIIHNPLYSPEEWRVSQEYINGVLNDGYDETHAGPYYNENLDINDPDGNGFDPAAYKPAVAGNLNGGTFRGVIIADQVNAINGNINVYGAVISLTDAFVEESAAGTSNFGAGTANILFSSEAISRYASGGGNSPYSTKLSWKKVTAY